MIVQISSGQGPAECELAVGKLFAELLREFPDIAVLEKRPSGSGERYTSILFRTDSDLGFLEGSVQWICRSPFRPDHKRKNWFVDVSIIPETDGIETDGEIRTERIHSGGKGGQNVNKVETGVRLTHIPTGITVTSTAERSQYQNRREALKKLKTILDSKAQQARDEQTNAAWQEHGRIVRGNPTRTYEGIGFTLKK